MNSQITVDLMNDLSWLVYFTFCQLCFASMDSEIAQKKNLAELKNERELAVGYCLVDKTL